MAGWGYGELDRLIDVAGDKRDGPVPHSLALVDSDTQTTLLGRLRVAGNFRQRFVGLMGAAYLDPAEGLLLRHCGSVHTFFMRFPIDIAYLDRAMRVVAVIPAVRPWRVVPGVKGGRHTLEAGAGRLEALGVAPGKRLAVEAV